MSRSNTAPVLSETGSVVENVRRFLDQNQSNTKEYINRFFQALDFVVDTQNTHSIKQEDREWIRKEIFKRSGETGNLLIHLLCGIKELAEGGRYSDLFSEIIQSFPEQINQPNNLGHTPLFLAFVSGNVKFFDQMVASRDGFKGVISILNFLIEPADIRKLIIFMDNIHMDNIHQERVAGIRIMETLYDGNEEVLELINRLIKYSLSTTVIAGKKRTDEMELLENQVLDLLASIIKKGTDVKGATDILQIILEKIREDHNPRTQEVKTQCFYNFLNNLKGDEIGAYINSLIENGIMGEEHFLASCIYGNKLVVKAFLDSSALPPPRKDNIKFFIAKAHKNIKPILLEYERKINQQEEEEKKEIEAEKKQRAEQKPLNFQDNLAKLQTIVEEKQNIGEWQNVAIKDLAVLLNGHQIFKLQKKYLEEKLWEKEYLQKQFTGKINAELERGRQEELKKLDEHKKIAEQIPKVKLLIQKLEQGKLETSDKLASRKGKKDELRRELETLGSYIARLQHLPPHPDLYQTKHLEELNEILKGCKVSLKIEVSDSELTVLLEEKRKVEMEQDRLAKVQIQENSINELKIVIRFNSYLTKLTQTINKVAIDDNQRNTDIANILIDYLKDDKVLNNKNEREIISGILREKMGEEFDKAKDDIYEKIGSHIAREIKSKNTLYDRLGQKFISFANELFPKLIDPEGDEIIKQFTERLKEAPENYPPDTSVKAADTAKLLVAPNVEIER